MCSTSIGIRRQVRRLFGKIRPHAQQIHLAPGVRSDQARFLIDARKRAAFVVRENRYALPARAPEAAVKGCAVRAVNSMYLARK
jgi:hypothetical protein